MKRIKAADFPRDDEADAQVAADLAEARANVDARRRSLWSRR